MLLTSRGSLINYFFHFTGTSSAWLVQSSSKKLLQQKPGLIPRNPRPYRIISLINSV
jgi:hypothetical protein